MCINSQPQATPAHSRTTLTMARTYPYLLPYRTCLGRLEDPCSFFSLHIEDLYSGQKVYVKHIQQIINVLPKTVDPSSRFTLRAQVTPLGHQCMRDSLRTALWWLLPKDGDFRRASDEIHYYLARQGWRVVLRGGNVTSPLHESRLHWVHDPHPNQRSAVPGSPVVPARVNQSTSQAVDPISPMRTAVYPPPESVGNSSTNENSPFQIGLESSRNLGLYKPAVPDQDQDTWAYDLEANSSGIGPPSPTRTFAANSSGSGKRTEIVYPLQPRGRRPDVCIEVEASLPEPAALLRPDLPKPESPTQPQEAPTSRQRASRRLSRKPRRNRSTAVFRPAKRSPPGGHWCD